MPYVPIPKDMTEVSRKTKFIGNFTARQVICFSAAAVIGLPIFFISKRYVGVELGTILMILAMLPSFLLAVYEKNGQYLEKQLWNYFERKYKRGTVRPYQTDNLYSRLQRAEKYRNEVESILQKAGKKHLIGPNDTLDRKTKKALERALKKAKRDGKIPVSAQDTIPYTMPYKDGIFEIEKGYYSRTIQFFDITYQLLDNDDKNVIFEYWCDFQNYFDKTIHCQFSFYNQDVDKTVFEKDILIKEEKDEFQKIRKEYADYLKAQLAKGHNGRIKEKFITVGIHADSYEMAKPRLEKITLDVTNNLLRFGVKSYPLNGYERLKLLHRILHPGTDDRFFFNWDAIRTGLSSKDFIAPTSFDFKDGPRLDAKRYFRVGGKIGCVNYMKIMAADLPDYILTEMLEIDSNIMVNLHLEPIDQQEALKMVRQELSNLQKAKIDEQKKAFRGGYDMDILPPELKSFEENHEKMYDNLQKRNERLFLATITTVQIADTKKILDNNVFQLNNMLQTYQCSLERLDDRQEQGYMSALPLGLNQIEIKRSMTTTSNAIFMPFATEELFQRGRSSIYYGMNAISNNMILANRLFLKNPNGLILGRPGAGKSFATKREIAHVFLVTDDDILILDPESEYKSFVEQLHGQLIEISLNSENHINPMDIDLSLVNDADKEYDAISEQCNFILSFCELILARNGASGLEPDQISILDRCSRNIYTRFQKDPRPENMPILEDLYNELLNQTGDAKEIGEYLANCLEIYVKGSLNVFNHRTNVDLQNRVACFDIKKLNGKMKKLGMLIIQNQIWARVGQNRGKKYTRIYLDEYHLLLKEPQTAAYSLEMWKRFRKWGGVPTGITQNVTDFLSSREIENIFSNSPFILMLDQAAADADILADTLGITDAQLKYIKDVEPGRGLLAYGSTIVPFVDDFPKDTLLYRVMTTKPDEVMV